jgi:hypothetical protein
MSFIRTGSAQCESASPKATTLYLYNISVFLQRLNFMLGVVEERERGRKEMQQTGNETEKKSVQTNFTFHCKVK